jgi:histidinol-phosphatase
MNPEWRARYETAVEVARRAGQCALRYFDTELAVEWKGDHSPVTVADRETELLLRTSLQQAFPGDGFLGEEYGDTPGTSGFRWVLDPIDGTRSFVRGIPLWGVLVGLEHHGELIAGVAEAAPLGQTYHALRGQGAFRNDRRIRVSEEGDLARSLVFYSGLSFFAEAGRQAEFLELVRRTDRQRGFGDFYGFMLVAQGSGELMVEHGVHVWDVAAIKPIVEEAGGRFSTWDGTADLDRPDVVVSNGKVHDEALRVLRGAEGG